MERERSSWIYLSENANGCRWTIFHHPQSKRTLQWGTPLLLKISSSKRCCASRFQIRSEQETGFWLIDCSPQKDKRKRNNFKIVGTNDKIKSREIIFFLCRLMDRKMGRKGNWSSVHKQWFKSKEEKKRKEKEREKPNWENFFVL